jgi:hypothetical protein
METESTSRPAIVTWLGYGGLLPFLALALASALDTNHRELWQKMLVSYGAVILSFVGAMHWAFAMLYPSTQAQPANGVYAWSVVPSLIAWGALLLSPLAGTTLLLGGLLAHYRQDLRLARLLPLPDWYLPLRLQLTLVASLCLASSFFLSLPLPAGVITA